MKKILLADESSVVRMGIRTLINENLPHCKIDEAGNEEQILRHIKHNNYELIFLDIQVPNIDFVRLMQWIKITSPDSQVLIFTMHKEDIYGLRCLNMGAKGFLRKNASCEEIVTAIKKVLNNERYISARLSDLLVENYSNPHKHGNLFETLSQRELEIVKHLDSGKPLPEICKILNIQYSTANTYKRRIFEKLKVKSVLELSRLLQLFGN